MFPRECSGAPCDSRQHSTGSEVRKDTGLPTEAVDYVHEPVAMHHILDFFQQLTVPDVLVVRLVLDAINHCNR